MPRLAPEPGVTSQLLKIAAKLRHVVTTRTATGLELGELRATVGKPWSLIVVAGPLRFVVEWALVDEYVEGLDVIPVLLTVRAGEVLTRGRLVGFDVRCADKSYGLVWLWAAGNVRRLYADAVEV
ncbi:MAG: hypothetical protein ABI134_07100 [Byssovorax sp.]